MRIALIAAVILGSGLPALAQELIPNPSFEQFTCCPTGPSELPCADFWSAPTTGTPDYMNACDTTDTVSVPINSPGFQDAYHGVAYGAFFAVIGVPAGYREYVQTPILAPGLEADKTYRLSARLSLADDSSFATDRIGAYFSATAPAAGDFFTLPVTPQIETPAGTFLDDTVGWMEFTDTYLAEGGEMFVTIGNFHDEVDSATIPAGSGPDPPLQFGSGYYYIDQVSLQCEPCIHPPDDLLAWWPLEEPSGPIASDIVYSLNGTYIGSPTPSPGHVGMCLDFLSSGLTVPTAPELEHDDGDFSMVALVRVDALGTTQTIFSKSPALFSGAGYVVVVNADGTIGFTMVDSSLASVTANSTDALVAGEWTLVIVGVDRSEASGGTIWVGGLPTPFNPLPAPGSLTNALPLLFALDGPAGAGADFTGGLDEVQIFNRALQVIEVAYLFDAHTSGQCKIFLEIEPVVGIPFTPGPLPTITTSGNLVNDTDVVATVSVTARGEPAGTRCGPRRSTVDGPPNVRILNQQPIQIPPGGSIPLDLEIDNPRNLGGGLACYSVTVTHQETGRVFGSVGGLRGPRGRRDLQPR